MQENKKVEITQNTVDNRQHQIYENQDGLQNIDDIILMKDQLRESKMLPTDQISNRFFKKHQKFILIAIIGLILIAGSFFYFIAIVPKVLSTNFINNQSSDQEIVVKQTVEIEEKDESYIEGEPTQEIYDLVKRNTTSAVCLDGSPGSYYISRDGDPTRVLIFFQPGGWCGDKDYQSTFRNCYDRSRGHYGSSKELKSTWRDGTNAFSKHPDNYFRNWKKIHFNYCDGAGHQGSRKQPLNDRDKVIYFRGHNITIEHFEDLEQKIGLFSKTKKIVVAGLSAGGLAVFTWANYVKERVKNAKVYALSDSGIFYDAENIQTKSHSYREMFINLMKISNQEIEPPVPECIRDNPTSKQNCMLAQHLHKYLKVPLFVIQSTFDSWSIQNIVGVGCSRQSECRNRTKEQKSAMSSYAKSVSQLLQEIGKKQSNGVFGIDCIIHGMMYYYTYTSKDFTIPVESGRTASKAIGEWIENPKGDNIHIDVSDWPSNGGCAKS